MKSFDEVVTTVARYREVTGLCEALRQEQYKKMPKWMFIQYKEKLVVFKENCAFDIYEDGGGMGTRA